MKKKFIFLFSIFLLLIAFNVEAQRKGEKKKPEYTRSNARFNFFPLFMGRLSANYEYQSNKNSLNANGNWGFAGRWRGFLVASNYRRYFHPKRTSFFLGLTANFSDYYETIEFLDEQEQKQDTKLRGQALLIAPNLGLRIRILRLINITGRFGYSNPFILRYTAGKIEVPNFDLDGYKRDFRIRSAFDGELSLGIHF